MATTTSTGPLTRSAGALLPIHCYLCGATNFVQPNLAPGTEMPCNKCNRAIMIPYLLRNFEIRQAIASGGMGTVYRAFDTILKREVAVKLMKKELGRDAKVLDDFYKEARVIAALNHPNIIHVYNFGEMDGENFIAMELADKGSVESRMKDAGGKLTELEVLDIGIKIAGALDVIYKQNLIHRDLKPANILFNGDNEPKLVDFGLAREADQSDEYGQEVWGTPEYSAPEKFKRESETFKSDMYSLGCTLYQALTGQLPFFSKSIDEMVRGHLETPVKPPRELLPEISQPMSDALVKTLAKKPKERFASYEELVMAFTAARSQLLVAGAAGTAATPKSQKIRGITGSLKKADPSPVSAVGSRPAIQNAPAASDSGSGSKKILLIGGLVAGLAIVVGGVIFSNKSKPVENTPPVVAAPTTPTPAPADAKPKAGARAGKPSFNAVAPERPAGIWTMLLTDLGKNWMRAEGTAPVKGAWPLANGELTSTAAKPQAILSRKAYEDFDLMLEWKADAGTSGTLSLGVQTGTSLTNALRVRIGDEPEKGAGKSGVGALTGIVPAAKDKALKPFGEWNTMRVVALGGRVECWMNGKRTVGFTLGSEEFNTKLAASPHNDNPGYAKTAAGHLGLQLSAGVTVRNLRIRGLTQMPAEILAAPATSKGKK